MKIFLSEVNIFPTEKFILNGLLAVPYFCIKRRFHTTLEYIGSLIDVPRTPSTLSGTPILAGRRIYVRARSTSPLIFAAPPVTTIHSGSIPSRPTFLSSIIM